MDTLLIRSKSRSNTRLISTIVYKLGEQVESLPKRKEDSIQTCLSIESAWAKDWLTTEEDEAWKDL